MKNPKTKLLEPPKFLKITKDSKSDNILGGDNWEVKELEVYN